MRSIHHASLPCYIKDLYSEINRDFLLFMDIIGVERTAGCSSVNSSLAFESLQSKVAVKYLYIYIDDHLCCMLLYWYTGILILCWIKRIFDFHSLSISFHHTIFRLPFSHFTSPSPLASLILPFFFCFVFMTLSFSVSMMSLFRV